MSSIIGFALAFVSALFKSSKSITTKIAAMDTDPYITSFATRFVGIIVFGFLIVLTRQFMIPTSNDFWIAFVINSVLLGTATIIFSRALQISDISIISPIMALLPVFVTVPAFFVLNEVPSIYAAFGLILISMGAYSLNIDHRNQRYLTPIKKVFTDRGVQIAFIGLIISSIIPSIDKIGIEASNPFLWVFATHIGSSVFIGLILIILIQDHVTDKLRMNIRILLLVGLASSLIWVFQSYAYTYTQVAYVQAVKRVSILLSVLAGYYLFEEKNIYGRIFGAILMLIGVTLIVLGH